MPRCAALRVGWSSTLGYASAEPGVEAAAYEAATALVERAGLTLVDVDVQFTKPGTSWSILSTLDTLATHYEAQHEHADELTDVLRAGLASYEHLRPDLMLAPSAVGGPPSRPPPRSSRRWTCSSPRRRRPRRSRPRAGYTAR